MVRRMEFVEDRRIWLVDGGNVRFRWHENGQMRLRDNWRDGKLHGLWEEWYENGQMYWRGNYKDGKRHGLDERWHKNGQMVWRTNWRDGIQIN